MDNNTILDEKQRERDLRMIDIKYILIGIRFRLSVIAVIMVSFTLLALIFN